MERFAQLFQFVENAIGDEPESIKKFKKNFYLQRLKILWETANNSYSKFKNSVKNFDNFTTIFMEKNLNQF